MKWRFVFKFVTLSIALTATVYCMYVLNTGHANDFWSSLGFGEPSRQLNWCSSRLLKMESAGQLPWTLEEKDQQWLVSVNQQAPTRIEYLEIEKWLAKYCSLTIDLYRSEKILDLHLQPFARVYFNDGSQAKIFRLENDIFQINEVIFKSSEMQDALKELKVLLKI